MLWASLASGLRPRTHAPECTHLLPQGRLQRSSGAGVAIATEVSLSGERADASIQITTSDEDGIESGFHFTTDLGWPADSGGSASASLTLLHDDDAESEYRVALQLGTPTESTVSLQLSLAPKGTSGGALALTMSPETMDVLLSPATGKATPDNSAHLALSSGEALPLDVQVSLAGQAYTAVSLASPSVETHTLSAVVGQTPNGVALASINATAVWASASEVTRAEI